MTVIHRRKSGETFTVILNRILNDRRLRPEVLGILVYLLSKPDNWQIRLAELIARFGVGRDLIRRIINALEAADYLRRIQNRFSGSFDGVEYVVTDDPAAFVELGGAVLRPAAAADGLAGAGKPSAGDSGAGNSGRIVNTDTETKTENETKTERGRAAPPRGTRISPNWHPLPDDLDYGRRLGFSGEAIGLIAESFHSYWLAVAGARALKADWPAAFRHWLATEAKSQSRISGGLRHDRRTTIVDAVLRNADR